MSCFSRSSHNDESCMKAFKVSTPNNSQKYGIAASSIKELLHKATTKLHIQISRVSEVVLAEDGTEIDDDDVLLSLPHNTDLVLLQKGETWQKKDESGATLEGVLKNLLSKRSHKKKQEVLLDLQNKINEEDNPELSQLYSLLHTAASQNYIASRRADDPEWFEGVDNRFKTKEAFMKERAKARVRGYLNTAKDANESKLLSVILKKFEERLKKDDYFSTYFDRTYAENQLCDCLCDKDGWFPCEGAYNVDECNANGAHLINPYGSFTERVSFSTWNLDHRIEKSREILPRLLDAVKSKPARKDVNWEYFYRLLFTRDNLKLVHIACHDKREHTSEKCDKKKFYV